METPNPFASPCGRSAEHGATASRSAGKRRAKSSNQVRAFVDLAAGPGRQQGRRSDAGFPNSPSSRCRLKQGCREVRLPLGGVGAEFGLARQQPFGAAMIMTGSGHSMALLNSLLPPVITENDRLLQPPGGRACGYATPPFSLPKTRPPLSSCLTTAMPFACSRALPGYP